MFKKLPGCLNATANALTVVLASLAFTMTSLPDVFFLDAFVAGFLRVLIPASPRIVKMQDCFGSASIHGNARNHAEVPAQVLRCHLTQNMLRRCATSLALVEQAWAPPLHQRAHGH